MRSRSGLEPLLAARSRTPEGLDFWGIKLVTRITDAVEKEKASEGGGSTAGAKAPAFVAADAALKRRSSTGAKARKSKVQAEARFRGAHQRRSHFSRKVRARNGVAISF